MKNTHLWVFKVFTSKDLREDYKNLKSDLKKRHKNRAELMLDNEDQTEGEWYGLRMGDLEDTNNKMAGNWE